MMANGKMVSSVEKVFIQLKIKGYVITQMGEDTQALGLMERNMEKALWYNLQE